jgi:protein ImuB
LLEVFGNSQRFGKELVGMTQSEGFSAAAVGVADSAVVAGLVAQWEGEGVHEVPVGGDEAYLAGLPIEALPIGQRMLRTLSALGLRHVGLLQGFSAAELCARFGPEGSRLAGLVRGLDLKRVWTSKAGGNVRREIPFPVPCEEVGAVRFALRAAIGDVAREVKLKGQVIVCLEVTLTRERGHDLVWRLVPSKATHDGALLWHLAEARLRTPLRQHPDVEESGTWIFGLSVEAVDTERDMPTQLSLFPSQEVADEEVQRALARVVGRLGGAALCRAKRADGHFPERSGQWHSAFERESFSDGLEGEGAPLLRACVRRLPELEPLTVVNDGFLCSAPYGLLKIVRRVGPEGLSGDWWRGERDRDYYWGVLVDGRVAWLFQDRENGAWFLQGWLD